MEEIRAVCESLAGTATRVLKALRINVETGEALFAVKDPFEACSLLEQSGIAGLVLDSKTSSRPAGTGVPLDWSSLRRVREMIHLPVILAGGLTPGNVKRAMELVQPYAVDVITGVEREAGVKDPQRMRDFVKAVKGDR
jgi:phosphoribosylanthranilate isomerase